jgi:hypothetical protein
MSDLAGWGLVALAAVLGAYAVTLFHTAVAPGLAHGIVQLLLRLF